MRWFRRFLTLLAAAVLFLLASFLGGMTNSVIDGLHLTQRNLWWGGSAGLILIIVGILRTWRRRPSSPPLNK